MKKIITSLFFVGIISSAFAQSGRHGQFNKQNNNSKGQSSWNDQSKNRGHENEYSYNNDRDHKDYGGRDGYRDRDGAWRNHNYREYSHHRREINYRNNRGGSWFRIVFNRHRH